MQAVIFQQNFIEFTGEIWYNDFAEGTARSERKVKH